MSLYFCATDSQEEPMARFQTQCNFQNIKLRYRVSMTLLATCPAALTTEIDDQTQRVFQHRGAEWCRKK